MSEQAVFYLCPKCFQVSEVPDDTHPHEMKRYNADKLTDEQRKPLFDAQGKLVTEAPRWFLESIGWIEKTDPT